jgi:sugar lactone lactonase YvrE
VDLGNYRLVVVNHGDREAVEFFEMGHSPRGPAIVWRGCTVIPDDVFANDVALLPDGGFLLTKMLGRGRASQLFSVVRMAAGLDTGHVLEWDAEGGFREVPESHGSGPNGVVVSPDGREIYFSEWTGPRLVRLRRDEQGAVIERKQVELPHHPDNITWTRDGLLLVAGQVGALGELLACSGTEEGTCRLPFSVLLVNPGTLDTTVVLEHPATAQGAASVALEVGDEIFIGTYDGDRVARAPFEH